MRLEKRLVRGINSLDAACRKHGLCKLPYDSFLYIEGRLTMKKKNDQMSTTLGNNCVRSMFDEIRYELNSVEIDTDYSRNVRITSTIKNYVSKNELILIRGCNDCNCLIGNPVTDPKIYLNSEFYRRILFDMSRVFVKHGINCFETLSFIKKGPFAIIYCENESVKSTTVDLRIEFNCKENLPANSTAYCLIIHDHVIEYCST
ncbi:hypothetical protein ALC53_00033 [Atta colombica]|uniref:Double jelly roll-like domain-containing protein n=1 Tax=Atta colombica TaxID=520822 RepID=A0A151K1E1_9HYME|nr:hypothetical protein ALC53_00033 [Atta colombica]